MSQMPETVEAGYKEMPWLGCLFTHDIIVSGLIGKGETRLAKPEEIEWWRNSPEAMFMERRWFYNKDHFIPESSLVEEKDSMAIAGKSVDTRVRFLRKPDQMGYDEYFDDDSVVSYSSCAIHPFNFEIISARFSLDLAVQFSGFFVEWLIVETLRFLKTRLQRKRNFLNL
jgi:hypothetical protein